MTNLTLSRCAIAACLMTVMLGGCATLEAPRNPPGSLYAKEQQSHRQGPPLQCAAESIPADVMSLTEVPAAWFEGARDTLGEGDRIQLTVAGDATRYSGSYVVSGNGSIELSGGISLFAAGQSIEAIERELRTQLLARAIVRPVTGNVRVAHVEQAALPIAVSGAVFNAGIVRVGERQADARNTTISNPAAGDLNASRTLATALRAAGGIRPDASISDIIVIRGTQWARIDMRGAINGTMDRDIRLASGDRIIVSSLGCLQPELMRPSPITAPGIRVFMANLASPGGFATINTESSSLPYGTRFLQALVSANCVGGSAMNAGRSAVLISRNPVTGQSVVIERSVERLVRAADRDGFDPYLMPGDSIACYDSLAMNLREVISTVSASVTPYVLFNSVKN